MKYWEIGGFAFKIQVKGVMARKDAVIQEKNARKSGSLYQG
jgi:hypothetical protein